MEWYGLLFDNDDRMSHGNLCFKVEQIHQNAEGDPSIVAEQSEDHERKHTPSSERSSVAENQSARKKIRKKQKTKRET
jgi:hypothetical protein